jgi:predicted metal-dependent hydrolase
VEQLACECGEPLPLLAQQAIQQFNQREFYQQHDSLEALWMETSTPVRDLYRAILQVGIAYYQIERGNHAGALKMLWRSKQWLAILPDVCQGVDVARLRQDAQAVEDAVLALSSHEMAFFDDRLLRPVMLVADRQP